MSTLEPLQYFASAVLVALVLAVWGLWSWCMRLVKERDRYEHEATYERNRANAMQARLDDLLNRNKWDKYAPLRESALSHYPDGRAAKK